MDKLLTFETESGTIYKIFEDNGKNFIERTRGEDSLEMRKDEEIIEIFEYSISLDEPALLSLESVSDNPAVISTIRQTSPVKKIEFH